VPLKVTIWKPETPEIHGSMIIDKYRVWIVGIYDYPWWETPRRQPRLAGEKSSYPLSMVNTAGYSDEWVFL
jgi:hypothetical protein